MKKAGIIMLSCFAAFILLFCLFLADLTLVKDRYRYGCTVLPQSVKEEIRENTAGMDEMDIIDYSVDLTARYLKFSSVQNRITFKDETEAHCVGYARLCSSICNYAFRINKIKASSSPVVGFLYTKFPSINLCKLSRSFFDGIGVPRWGLFTKDHDYVEINLSDKTVYVDPSFYDLIGCKMKQVVYK